MRNTGRDAPPSERPQELPRFSLHCQLGPPNIPHMSSQKPSRTELTQKQQTYVEVIAELQERHDHAHVSHIAEELAVSKPSVVQMLDRLVALKVVRRQQHEVVLTNAGHRLSQELSRRHALLRDFMVHHLGMTERAADADACRIEHVVSSAFVTRLRKLCGTLRAKR